MAKSLTQRPEFSANLAILVVAVLPNFVLVKAISYLSLPEKHRPIGECPRKAEFRCPESLSVPYDF